MRARVSAAETALAHVDADASRHVATTGTKPMSLPPTVIVASVVDRSSGPSWPPRTVVVVAPEQATNAKDASERSAAHRAG